MPTARGNMTTDETCVGEHETVLEAAKRWLTSASVRYQSAVPTNAIPSGMKSANWGYGYRVGINHSASGVFGPAVTIGAGLGGLFDGIVLHQLLGWHHLLSSRAGFSMRVNEAADGAFHAVAWLVVLIGVLWLFARLRLPLVPAAWPRTATGPRSWRVLLGSMLVGWGLFNVVEGLVDHQILGLHHVRPGSGQLGWDLGFLAVGAVVAGAGFFLARSPREAIDEAASG